MLGFHLLGNAQRAALEPHLRGDRNAKSVVVGPPPIQRTFATSIPQVHEIYVENDFQDHI
jgi:hypothetical protein